MLFRDFHMNMNLANVQVVREIDRQTDRQTEKMDILRSK